MTTTTILVPAVSASSASVAPIAIPDTATVPAIAATSAVAAPTVRQNQTVTVAAVAATAAVLFAPAVNQGNDQTVEVPAIAATAAIAEVVANATWDQTVSVPAISATTFVTVAYGRYARADIPRLVAGQINASGATFGNTIGRVNEAFRKLEQGAAWFSVVNDTRSSSPGMPVDGDAYIVTGTASGGWTGFSAKDIAVTVLDVDGNPTYRNITPWEGCVAWDREDEHLLLFDGSNWTVQAAQTALTDNTGGGDGNSVEDVTASYDQGILNGNFASVAADITALRAALVAIGVIS